MAYNIKRSDPLAADIIINDNVVNDTDTSLSLVGRNKINYGEPIATTQVHMLENFASPNEPSNPIPGQLWYDKSTSIIRLNTSTTDVTPNWTAVVVTESIGESKNIGTSGSPYGNIYGTTLHGKTKAQYADLAERFHADEIYRPGTIVSLGGKNEITETVKMMDSNVLGVIAENPAFMMNEMAGTDDTHPYVALAGRVEVFVTGMVEKGARIASSELPGVGFAPNINSITPFAVIGRALEAKDTTGVGKIWIVVGAK